MEIDLDLYRKTVAVSEDPLVRLSVIDVWPANASRTAVFLHGYGGQARQWVKQLRHFCEENRVIAYDFRGHATSDKPDSTYEMDELVSDLEALLAALDVPEQFVLVAHSFGGAVAVEYALRHPERVDKLVLIGMAANFSLGRWPQMVFRVPSRFLEPVRPAFKTLYAPVRVLKKLYTRTLATWEGWPRFPLLDVPTLVIAGHKDAAFPSARASEIADQIPGAQMITIPVAAHMVPQERPDAVNRAIERFIGEAPPSWRDRKARDGFAAERPWLRHYELGVPQTIILPNQPLHRFLESAARSHPRRPATIFYDRKLNYRQLDRQANRFAHALGSLDVEPGDRVIVLLPNTPQCVIAYYGTLKAGAVVVLTNPLFTEDELVHRVEDTGADTIITLSMFYDMARRVQERTGLRNLIVTNFKEYLPWNRRLYFTLVREKREGHRVDVAGQEGVYRFQELLRDQPTVSPPVAQQVGADDLAAILYTGGTTDDPKGVMLTHLNLASNALQTRHWITDAQDGREVLLAVLPFSHSYGMTACMNLAVCLASAMVLMPTFVTSNVLKVIAKQRPTLFPGIPSMYVAINNHPQVKRFRTSSIRACISGAAPLPVEVQEAFEKLTRGKLVEGYGLTEAGPVTHANPLRGRRQAGAIGVPFPSTEARIVDLETGADQPPGEIGELVVRGPQVMRGYWNQPAATAEVLSPDGWLHTGDLARMDGDGYFQIINRKKDMIIAGPYNVYPRDVEEVLYEHPKVLEAAVVGIPGDDGDGEGIRAFVVLKRGEMATPEEIIELCQHRLEDYKVPQTVEFRVELPKTMVGKVLRRALAEESASKDEG